MTEVIVKIMVELLSVLALASKQIKEGRFSRCNVAYIGRYSICHREIHEEDIEGKRDRDCASKIGSIDPRRGPDDCCTNLGVVHGLVGSVKVVMEGA
jgi:hypothetical protein